MTEKPQLIIPSQPREQAQVTFEDGGGTWSAPLNTTLETYYRAAYPDLIPMTRRPGADDSKTVIASIVNRELRELAYPIRQDATVRPVLLSDSDGLRIYRRSLSLLLIVAAKELFPDRKINIDHSLPFGGYYCTVQQGEPFTRDDLKRIKARMKEIVAADELIIRRRVPLDEAIELFTENGDVDKLRLMENRAKDYLILYELRGVLDYFYGYMVPSAGYLTLFNLTDDAKDGFILHYPRRAQPNRLQPISSLPKLRSIFLETAHWLELLGVEDIGALGQAIRSGHARELILVAEALHEGHVADVADAIVERQPEVRLVLIAGPSSSGKTTSGKRLAIQLMAHGLKPYPIGLDNYFVNREDTPLDKDGEYDYEHLETVDLEAFNRDLLGLMDGQEVRLPRYNFLTGQREPGDVVRLTPEHIIIVEGIHALNPELVRDLPSERVFRLYVSCLTQLNIDSHNRVPTTDVRLLRRIVRDAAYRGYTAQETLSRWKSVRDGERRWIFPYQENADMMFNTALVYELAALRPLAEPLLLQVEFGSPEHIEAKRLLSFLNWVEPLKQTSLISANSLLREFIGEGVLHDYTPGTPDRI